MFADEFKKLRLRAGVTQEEVAAKAGVSREYVSMLESGRSQPTLIRFIKLCRAVKASPATLIEKIDRTMR